MDNNYVVQSLIESFNTLKGNWQTKSASLINCIVSMEKYDSQLSMEMWETLLSENESKLCERETAQKLIHNVILGFYENNNNNFADSESCLTLFTHCFLHIINNIKIIRHIFGYAYDCGSFPTTYLYSTAIGNNFIPILLANILVSKNALAAKTLIIALGQNHYFENESIGQLFSKSHQYVKIYLNNDLFAAFKNDVTEEVKGAMLNSVDAIDDAECRAECTISILSL